MIRLLSLLILLLSGTRVNGLSIVITGSSQGIGADAASRWIENGHTVIHACRNPERAQAAVQHSGGGRPMVCDLQDFASIRQFANDVQIDQHIDVLCLNAGVAPSTKAVQPKLTKDGYEECVGTNHLGHFLLANLLAPNIDRLVVTASSVHDPDSPGGSIGGKGGATLGDISGLGHRLDVHPNGPTMIDGSINYDGRKVYNDSKLCNVLFCREALNRWPKISIRSLNPGFIPSSGLFREPRNDNWFAATAFTVFATLAGFAVPISVGGERLAYMATSENIPSGSYFSAEAGSKAITPEDGFDDTVVSKEAMNDELSVKLWDRSIEIVGLA